MYYDSNTASLCSFTASDASCTFVLLTVALSSSPPFFLIGVIPPPGRGLQLREQCTDRLVGDRSGHSNCDRDQPGASEEEAIWHHQSRHCGGEPQLSIFFRVSDLDYYSTCICIRRTQHAVSSCRVVSFLRSASTSAVCLSHRLTPC